MRTSVVCFLRRHINSPYHPFEKMPKASKWMRREQLYYFNAWQYGTSRSTVRRGFQQVNKTLIYMSMQRDDEQKLEAFYAMERLKAALAEHEFEYKHLRSMLDKAHILLDNVILSQLAIYEPRTFQSIVSLAREMALREGRVVLKEKESDPVQVHIDSSIFGEPFPRAIEFPKGAAENHKRRPPKLRVEEY